MSVRTEPWPTGVPCWPDLSTPDPAGAAAFYAAVLGWEVVEAGPDLGGYSFALAEGHPAAGIGASGPPSWNLSLASDDAAATQAGVLAAGGSVIGPVRDVGTLGRLAVLADPTGAPFGVWQAGEHLGARWVNAPGGMVWEDLRSSDPAASRAFYADVFGWTFTPLSGDGGQEYGTVANPDAPWPVGGIGPLWGARPGWLVYFAVADCDASVAAAVAAGGRVDSAPEDTPYGRMGRISDPAGLVFAVMTPPPGAPQPGR